jgi:hypothetical protein
MSTTIIPNPQFQSADTHPEQHTDTLRGLSARTDPRLASLLSVEGRRGILSLEVHEVRVNINENATDRSRVGHAEEPG